TPTPPPPAPRGRGAAPRGRRLPGRLPFGRGGEAAGAAELRAQRGRADRDQMRPRNHEYAARTPLWLELRGEPVQRSELDPHVEQMGEGRAGPGGGTRAGVHLAEPSEGQLDLRHTPRTA